MRGAEHRPQIGDPGRRQDELIAIGAAKAVADDEDLRRLRIERELFEKRGAAAAGGGLERRERILVRMMCRAAKTVIGNGL
jgi:hypothetical protein